MPTLSRLDLKPSPREFDIQKFNIYVEELKKSALRMKLFATILRRRNFDEIREINADNPEQASLEINQCLIEALDVALNTPEEYIEDEFEMFDQAFHIPTSQKISPLKARNKIYF